MSLQDAAHRTSGYAIAALILGIAGVVTVSVVPSILAIVCGIKARRDIRSGAFSGGGLARAGIFLGVVGIGIAAAAVLVFLIWLGSL